MVKAWFTAFVWTLALELPSYAVALRGRLTGVRLLAVVLALNVATHPAIWFLLPRFEPWAAWFVLAEALVIAVEATLLRTPLVGCPLGRRDALLATTAANALSASVGFWLLRVLA